MTAVGVFARKLRGLRRWHQLTQRQLADELGMALSTYQRLENGEVEASRPVLLHLSDRFDVTLDYLARAEAGDGDMLPEEGDRPVGGGLQKYDTAEVVFLSHRELATGHGLASVETWRFRDDRQGRRAGGLFFKLMRELGPTMTPGERGWFESFFKRFCDRVDRPV